MHQICLSWIHLYKQRTFCFSSLTSKVKIKERLCNRCVVTCKKYTQMQSSVTENLNHSNHKMYLYYKLANKHPDYMIMHTQQEKNKISRTFELPCPTEIVWVGWFQTPLSYMRFFKGIPDARGGRDKNGAGFVTNIKCFWTSRDQNWKIPFPLDSHDFSKGVP